MNSNEFKQINAFLRKLTAQSNTRHLSWIKQFGGRLQSEIIEQLGAQVPALLTTAEAQEKAACDL